MLGAHFGTLLGMCTTNLECELPFLRRIATGKGILQSHCKY
jgi:hypothetical protein